MILVLNTEKKRVYSLPEDGKELVITEKNGVITVKSDLVYDVYENKAIPTNFDEFKTQLYNICKPK